MHGTFADPYIAILSSLRQSIAKDPKRNPTEHLAYQISTEIENGTATLAKLGSLAKNLSDQAFERRAAHIRSYTGLDDADSLKSRLDELITATLMKNGSPVSFEQFASHWQNARYGAVFTAHPTFGMNREMRQVMADLASCNDEDTRNQVIDRLSSLPHVADETISLEDEHEDVQNSIERIQGALNWLNKQVLHRARTVWPDQWKSLNPAPISIASWVGYDLDGRTDIGWQQMIGLRLEEKAVQLERYLGKTRELNSEALSPLVDALESALKTRIIMGEPKRHGPPPGSVQPSR